MRSSVCWPNQISHLFLLGQAIWLVNKRRILTRERSNLTYPSCDQHRDFKTSWYRNKELSIFTHELRLKYHRYSRPQNKDVFSRPGGEINTDTHKRGELWDVWAEEWGVPLGQEMGAVTTGSQCENDRRRIPTASPILSSPLLCFVVAFFVSSGSSSLRAHNHHSVVSPGVWGYSCRKAESESVMVPAFVCADDKNPKCLCFLC